MASDRVRSEASSPTVALATMTARICTHGVSSMGAVTVEPAATITSTGIGQRRTASSGRTTETSVRRSPPRTRDSWMPNVRIARTTTGAITIRPSRTAWSGAAGPDPTARESLGGASIAAL
jgi:hypothetical protein